MNADLQQIILLNIEETVKHIRATNRKASSGVVFATDQISKQMNMAPQQVSEALEGLVRARKLHRVSRDHYSLGDNPWGGQRRQKIFKCQHCGMMNTVDITGD
jgi:hypothetical protein